MSEAVTLAVFIPARRCLTRNCGAVFVGFDPRCAKCMNRIQMQRDSRRENAEHKRLSLRKRLALLATEAGA